MKSHSPVQKRLSAASDSPAFTLIELLVVIAIVLVLAGLVVPATTSIFEGNSLSRGGDMVEQAMVQARQYALSKNLRTELRFYKYEDLDGALTGQRIHALQVFAIEDNGSARPITKVLRLPGGIVINESSALSNLTAHSSRSKSFSSSDPKTDLPGISSYTASFVRFFPDGRTDLGTTSGGDSGKWYVTLHAAKFDAGQANPPANFYTLQVDPINGTVRSLRP